MKRSRSDAALARGLAYLLAAGSDGLPEAELMARCGRVAAKQALRDRLACLERAGLVSVRAARGRARGRARTRIVVEPLGRRGCERFVAEHLSERTRLPGRVVRRILAGRQSSSEPPPPTASPSQGAGLAAQGAAVRAGTAGTGAPELVADLAALSAGSGRSLVRLVDLARQRGLAHPACLEAELRTLEDRGLVSLEPLADPSVVAVGERDLGLRDPVRGLLYYVRLTRET